MFRKMVIPEERIAERESEDTDDTDSVPDTALIGDIGESSSSDMLSPDIPSSPAHTRSHGKAKKKKDREPMLKLYVYVEIVTLQFFQMSTRCNVY